MCIRALDYLPPVDVTFFEYLRALITADFDLVGDDRYNYRVAFVEAFRRRGIYPPNLEASTADMPRTLSVDTLRWQGLALAKFSADAQRNIEAQYGVINGLKRYTDACFYLEDRRKLFGDAPASAQRWRCAHVRTDRSKRRPGAELNRRHRHDLSLSTQRSHSR